MTQSISRKLRAEKRDLMIRKRRRLITTLRVLFSLSLAVIVFLLYLLHCSISLPLRVSVLLAVPGYEARLAKALKSEFQKHAHKQAGSSFTPYFLTSQEMANVDLSIRLLGPYRITVDNRLSQVTLSLSRGEMISLDASPVPAYPVEFSQSIGAEMTYALIVE